MIHFIGCRNRHFLKGVTGALKQRFRICETGFNGAPKDTPPYGTKSRIPDSNRLYDFMRTLGHVRID